MNFHNEKYFRVFNVDKCYKDINPTNDTIYIDLDHTHQYDAILKTSDSNDNSHKHHFVGTTDASIYLEDGSHYHEIFNKSDVNNDHYHCINSVTGPSIDVGDGKHIHLVYGDTSIYNRHMHKFQFATSDEDILHD